MAGMGHRTQRPRRLWFAGLLMALALLQGGTRLRLGDFVRDPAWLFPWRSPASPQMRRAADGVRGHRSALQAAARASAAGGYMPTAEAPFLNPTAQPFILSPNGLRTGRFEYTAEGLILKVEAAPTFGPPGQTFAAATARDISEAVKIIPPEKLGIMGVRDLFWLDDRCFLITGYEGDSGLFNGWVADLRSDTAKVVSMPARDASLFVPVGMDGFPMLRKDERGEPEVLLGFKIKNDDGTFSRSWNWYQTSTGDLVDAADTQAVDAHLPTSEWREAHVCQHGIVQAILHVNGTVHRKMPGGSWQMLGTVALAAEEGASGMDEFETILPRQYLIGAGSDHTAFVLDTLGPESGSPQMFPPLQHLTGTDDAVGDVDAAWVRKQCQDRQTIALLKMVKSDSTPEAMFAHPFADVTPVGIWVNPDNGYPDIVMVEDLRPRAYALNGRMNEFLLSLQSKLPSQVALADVLIPSADLSPILVERHGDRWLVYYWHPSLSESIVLPVIVKDSVVEWVGQEALPARGGTLSAAAVKLKPQVEGHRLEGAHEIPLYLVLPESQQPAALVVRVHEGPRQRDCWGADDVDAWLLSRNYAVLKVNYRGSSGFGRAWAAAAEVDGEDRYMADIVHAVRWALDERQVLAGYSSGNNGDSEFSPPPVAIMGSYFASAAVLQGLVQHKDLFACGVAIGPAQYTADPNLLAELRAAPLLAIEFERDAPDSRDQVLPCLAEPGCSPSSWPAGLHYVQYAGEGRGGGMVRQNGIDQYRRIDDFLYSHLARAPRVEGEQVGLLKEGFVEELPFLSSAIMPAMRGKLSTTARYLEKGFAEGLKDIAATLTTRGTGVGFSGQGGNKEIRKRKLNKFPASRLRVRTDGTIELTVSLPAEPKSMYVLLSEVWLHMAAEELSHTVSLPRKPRAGVPMKVFRLEQPGHYVFEIEADPTVGAIENYNEWSGTSTIMASLTPEDIAAAPMFKLAESEKAAAASGEDDYPEEPGPVALEAEVVA